MWEWISETLQSEAVINAVLGAIGFILVTYIVPILNTYRKSVEEKLKTENLDNKDKIKLSLTNYLSMEAQNIVERGYPKIAEKIRSGEISGLDDIKKELYAYGIGLKNKAIKHFTGEGIDLVAEVGDDYIDKAIEYVVNKVSPFPGRDTAKELLTGKVTDMLINFGVEYVRKQYIKKDEKGTK